MESLAKDIVNAKYDCKDIMGYIQAVSGNVLNYDFRIFDYDWDPIESAVTDYFTVSARVLEIYDAIHIENSTKVPVFDMNSGSVSKAWAYDNLTDYTWYVQELIRMKYHMLLYAGEFDAQDGPKTQEFWLRQLQFEGSEDFWAQSRQVYYVPQPNSSDLIIGGYWRESKYFSYLTVPKSGHFVPANYYQPTYQFVYDYVHSKGLKCHKTTDAGCSVVESRCTFMNQCSNNGTCNANGTCVCNSGFKGADCSAQAVNIDETFTKY